MFSNHDNKIERVPKFPGKSPEKVPADASQIAQAMLATINRSIELADAYLGEQATVLDRVVEAEVEDEAA